MKATINNLYGQAERVDLPTPIYNNTARGFHEDYGTGVELKRVWYGPRTRRAFIETDSIWDDGTGRCRGCSISEIEIEHLLRICDKFSIDVPLNLDNGTEIN